MNRKVIILVIAVCCFIISLIFIVGNQKKIINNQENPNLKKGYYEKVQEDGSYIIYDENGEEVERVEDERLLDAQMYLYEIDPDYDG